MLFLITKKKHRFLMKIGHLNQHKPSLIGYFWAEKRKFVKKKRLFRRVFILSCLLQGLKFLYVWLSSLVRLSCWSLDVMMCFPYAITYGEVIISWRLHHDYRQVMIMCSAISAEGRVEHQKLKHTVALLLFGFWCSNRFTRKILDHPCGTYL